MANFKKKRDQYLLYVLAYTYIFIGFSGIIYYISYTIRITNKLEGWAVMLFNALLYFIAYAIINHLITIKTISSHKLLITIEALLFVAMLTLVISDWKYESYQHLKYLQKATSTTISTIK